MNFIRSLAVYRHPKVIAVFFLGFASGLPLALIGSTLSAWLTDVGVNLKTIGLFALVTTPYALKWLWAPLVDQLPIPYLSKVFGQRRSWMIVAQGALMAAIMALGATDPYETPLLTAFFAVMVAFTSATQDITIDAYRVELLKTEQQGAGAAMIVGGYRVGMLVSGGGALFLADATGDDWLLIYGVMAACIMVGMVTILIMGEPRTVQERTTAPTKIGEWLTKAVVSPFGDFFSRDYAILMLLFVVFYKFGDALAGHMTMTFLIETGFTKGEIATIVKFYGFFATLGGAFIGGAMVYRLGIIRSLWICGILQMLSNLMFVVQAHVGYDTTLLAFTIGAENLASGMGTAAFVAYLSSLCNISYTATQYALLSSMSSLGRTVLSAGSGFLVIAFGDNKEPDWEYFFLFSTCAAIPGLIFLKLLTHHLTRDKLQEAV